MSTSQPPFDPNAPYPPPPDQSPGQPFPPYGEPSAGQPYWDATAPQGHVAVIPVPQPSLPLLVRPLPWWGFVLGAIVIVSALVGLAITGVDWPDAAVRVGWGTGGFAVLLVLILGMRLLSGLARPNNPRSRQQISGAAILIVILALLGGAGPFLQQPLRTWQDGVLESQQQWTQALALYMRAGEKAPNGADLARIYNAWGESLSKALRYSDALAKFSYVLTAFPAVQPQIARAQHDTVATYLAWGEQSLNQKQFFDATQHFDALLLLPYCDATCQSTASPLDATAYYSLAESYLASGNYLQAVGAFQALQTRFPTSPEAKTINADFAKALYGASKAALAQGNCSSAIQFDQHLVHSFANTPQAKQAAVDLKAPQPVKGSFQDFVYPGGFVVLLQHVTQADFANNNVINLINNGGILAPLQPDGSFETKPVPQRTYDLIWGVLYSDGSASIIGEFAPTGAPAYIAQVEPLCPFDFGSIPGPFVPSAFSAPVQHAIWRIATPLGALRSH